VRRSFGRSATRSGGSPPATPRSCSSRGRPLVAGLDDLQWADPGERLLAEVAGAGGNPLFVTELVEALRQEGAITVAGGGAELAARTLPTTLRLTILRRLGFLPGDTLRAAAILGSGFSLAELSATTGRSALELSSALAEAALRRLGSAAAPAAPAAAPSSAGGA